MIIDDYKFEQNMQLEQVMKKWFLDSKVFICVLLYYKLFNILNFSYIRRFNWKSGKFNL